MCPQAGRGVVTAGATYRDPWSFQRRLKCPIRQTDRYRSELVAAFRAGLDACDKSGLPDPLFYTFSSFSSGACGDASLLLAKFLEQHRLGPSDYVIGKRANRSHAWLQRGDLVLDIAADQFDDSARAVIVEYGSEWHLSFCRESQRVADYESYDQHTRAGFRARYRQIIACIEAWARPPSAT